MLQDEIIKTFLGKAKRKGMDAFDRVEYQIEHNSDPLLLMCKKRFDQIKWVHWVYKEGGYFSDCARADLIKEGYLREILQPKCSATMELAGIKADRPRN
jgi:hypothetical protein